MSPVLLGSLAMAAVGGSAAVSATLGDAPLGTAQSLRYAVACLLLVALGRGRVRRPRGTEWLWLAGVTGTGLVLFNVALVAGAPHAEPALFGVAVACTPLVLAVAGPLLEGRRPTARAALAAAVVTAGAALVQGTGSGDAVGLAWAAVVLACEAGFTLLAVPVLGRLGPWGVSVHTTWMAAVGFGLAAPFERRGIAPADLAAVAYLAVAVTAVAFVLWYGAVRRLGAARAGLLTGVAPVAAAVAGIALGRPAPAALVWVGVAVVAAGLVTGLRHPGGARSWPNCHSRTAVRPGRLRAAAGQTPRRRHRAEDP